MRLPHSLRISANHSTPTLTSGRVRVFVLVACTAALLVLAVAFRTSILSGGTPATASEQLAQLRQDVPHLIVYSEFGYTTDAIWATDPNDPSRRASIAAVDHSPGYAINPSLSPDGTHLAYVALPPAAATPDAGQLWVIDIAAETGAMLADNVDLTTTPEWNPAGDALVVRSLAGGANELVLIDLDGGATTLSSEAEGLFPIAFAQDGASLYYAAFAGNRTALAEGNASGTVTVLADLGEGLSRDWSLSPDGMKVAYLGQTFGDRFVFDARVFDLATGIAEAAVAGVSGSQFGPVWAPDGALTVGSAPDAGAAGAAVTDGSASAAPESGFDVPLSWSPDSEQLIVRHFDGSSASDPGASRVIIIDAAGTRLDLSSVSDVQVAGWLE
jgi:Tol biopolymer transport system component